jgi:hypothetical protein
MATTDVRISTSELRALAEASDALRNVDSCVVANPNGDTPAYIVVTQDFADANRLTPVISLHTDDDPRLNEARGQLILRTDRQLIFRENRAHDINQCDAIFTSLSAVEKFVAPYYARVLGLKESEAMRERFATDADVVAMMHLPSSVEDEAALGPAAHILAAVQGSRDSQSSLRLLSVEQLLAM